MKGPLYIPENEILSSRFEDRQGPAASLVLAQNQSIIKYLPDFNTPSAVGSSTSELP